MSRGFLEYFAPFSGYVFPCLPSGTGTAKYGGDQVEKFYKEVVIPTLKVGIQKHVVPHVKIDEAEILKVSESFV